MQTVVIYDTKFGNTEQIALAIGRGAGTSGEVRIVATDQVGEALAAKPDLLLVGGPTQKRTMSPGLRDLVERLPSAILTGTATAAFDTRYRGSTWLMGSAANAAAKRLQKAGARMVGSAESFFIGRGGPLEHQTLEPGEVERAEAWGRAVSAAAMTGGAQG